MKEPKTYAGLAVVATAIGLLIYGIAVCPPGIIDETVIKAASVCFAFAAAVLGVNFNFK